MELSLLLLYLGTMLIASQLISRLGDMAAFGLLISGVVLSHYVVRAMRRLEAPFVNFRRSVRITLSVITITFAILVQLPLLPFMAIFFAVGLVAVSSSRFDTLLTSCIRSLLSKTQTVVTLGYIPLFLPRKYNEQQKSALMKKFIQRDIEELSKEHLPFLGAIGLILITAGFILEVA